MLKKIREFGLSLFWPTVFVVFWWIFLGHISEVNKRQQAIGYHAGFAEGVEYVNRLYGQVIVGVKHNQKIKAAGYQLGKDNPSNP